MKNNTLMVLGIVLVIVVVLCSCNTEPENFSYFNDLRNVGFTLYSRFPDSINSMGIPSVRYGNNTGYQTVGYRPNWNSPMNCRKPCVGGMGRPRCCNSKNCSTPMGSPAGMRWYDYNG